MRDLTSVCGSDGILGVPGAAPGLGSCLDLERFNWSLGSPSEERRHHGAHLQANDHVPQEIVLPFVFASVFKDPERHKQRRGWEGVPQL